MSSSPGAQEGLGSPQLSWISALSAGMAAGEVFSEGVNTGTRSCTVPRSIPGGTCEGSPPPPSSQCTPTPWALGVLGTFTSARGKDCGGDQIQAAFKTWEDTAKGARFRIHPCASSQLQDMGFFLGGKTLCSPLSGAVTSSELPRRDVAT